ncbi:hypothetical protein E0Z10_g7629 [Xylaria hypoxylon]|uniref:Uncharacterized protein n=1 Tax=Xylaria hypoxylon TaxID=37992 RepID=A0A4Z0YXL7_9PEZI|nr:hypothetical protein E0Z10_g7629 [Xylaria hypoxylon]
MAPVSSKLSLALGSRAEQLKFVQSIWPKIKDGDFASADYKFLFEFVSRYLRKKSDDCGPAYFEGTRGQVDNYIQRLQEHLILKKADLIAESTFTSHVPDDVVSQMFEIAATLFLGTPVDTTDMFGRIKWDSTVALGEAVQTTLGSVSVSNSVDSTEGDNIPTHFTMHYLCSRYKYKVVWTDDLRQHLDINTTYREIKVYEHLICLWNHSQFSSPPLPKAIIDEVINTLVLLFPPNKKKTKKFLKDNGGRTFYKLGQVGHERCLKLSKYHHWRDRVSELRIILDDPPRGLYQLLLPHQNGQNFLDWVTFLVVLFTNLVVLGFGVCEAVYAARSYMVNNKQLGVAIGMACTDEKTANALAKYCP